MLHYSTCTTCRELLVVSESGQARHPTCSPTPIEVLTESWVSAVEASDQAGEDKLQAEIDALGQPGTLGMAARWYAEQGWPVFPLLEDSKKPAVRNGFKSATTDVEAVAAWWKNNPMHNIGLPTGHRFDVVDVDGPTGLKSFNDLPDGVMEDIHGKVNTPRGFHFYVLPAGRGNRAGVRPGLDYRGEGGYVCAPPSRFRGRRWSWITRPSLTILNGV